MHLPPLMAYKLKTGFLKSTRTVRHRSHQEEKP
jgi:hypothetical protein